MSTPSIVPRVINEGGLGTYEKAWGGLYITGPVHLQQHGAATNVLDNGEVPISAAFANMDANGGARSNIKFQGAGTAGQILIVRNSGGEALTFHNTEGTALLRGVHADHDTMEAGFIGIFVSDGVYWNIIAGGVDTQPDAGLTAS